MVQDRLRFRSRQKLNAVKLFPRPRERLQAVCQAANHSRALFLRLRVHFRGHQADVRNQGDLCIFPRLIHRHAGGKLCRERVPDQRVRKNNVFPGRRVIVVIRLLCFVVKGKVNIVFGGLPVQLSSGLQ